MKYLIGVSLGYSKKYVLRGLLESLDHVKDITYGAECFEVILLMNVFFSYTPVCCLCVKLYMLHCFNNVHFCIDSFSLV